MDTTKPHNNLPNTKTPTEGLSIAEEYQLLLQGKRMTSRRAAKDAEKAQPNPQTMIGQERRRAPAGHKTGRGGRKSSITKRKLAKQDKKHGHELKRNISESKDSQRAHSSSGQTGKRKYRKREQKEMSHDDSRKRKHKLRHSIDQQIGEHQKKIRRKQIHHLDEMDSSNLDSGLPPTNSGVRVVDAEEFKQSTADRLHQRYHQREQRGPTANYKNSQSEEEDDSMSSPSKSHLNSSESDSSSDSNSCDSSADYHDDLHKSNRYGDSSSLQQAARNTSRDRKTSQIRDFDEKSAVIQKTSQISQYSNKVSGGTHHSQKQQFQQIQGKSQPSTNTGGSYKSNETQVVIGSEPRYTAVRHDNQNAQQSQQQQFDTASDKSDQISNLSDRSDNQEKSIEISGQKMISIRPKTAKKVLMPNQSADKEQQLSYKQNKNLIERKVSEFSQIYKKCGSNQSRIECTPENLDSLFNTICTIEEKLPISGGTDAIKSNSQNTPIKEGILLRAKYQKDDIQLFFKLLPQVNRRDYSLVDWFWLSKHKIISDISLGFVSENFLQTMNPHSNPSVIAFCRTYKDFVNQRTVVNKQKPKQHKIKKGEQKKPAEPRQDKGTCVKCKYSTANLNSYICSCCQKRYHEQCLDKPQLHKNISVSEKMWRCDDCKRCSNCFSRRNKQQLVTCKKCNSSFHYDCIDTSYKSCIKQFHLYNDNQQVSLADYSDFKCEDCIQCKNCGKEEAGPKRSNKWSKDFKLCHECNNKRRKKEYCPICLDLWQDQVRDVQIQAFDSDRFQHSDAMISCCLCKMWVHMPCDRMLEELNTFRKLTSQTGQQQKYVCVPCRHKARSNFLSQLIQQLMNEDKNGDFIEPFWEQKGNQNYLKIIKEPMCFSIIINRVHQVYLRNAQRLKSDCALIFSNAQIFNDQKKKLHKIAIRLEERCMQIISKFWNLIKQNELATLDEDMHSNFIRLERKWEKKYQQAGLSKRPEQPKYQLKPSQLFQEHEQIFGLQLGSIKDGLSLQIESQHHDQVKQYSESEMDASVDQSNISTIKGSLRRTKKLDYNEDHLQSIQEKAAKQSGQFLLGKRRKIYGSSCKNTSDFSFEQLIKANERLLKQNDSIVSLPQISDIGVVSNQDNSMQVTEVSQNDYVNHRNMSSFSQAQSANIVQSNSKNKQQKFLNWLRSTDDQSCYYSNPIRVSFDDPILIFEEMCYLCGAFGNHGDFLSCNLCCESFHTYCLGLPKSDPKLFQPYWKCTNCRFCETCHQATDEHVLLCCESCDKAYHTRCLDPPLSRIPDCYWKCNECFKCVSCGTQNFFNNEDIHNRVNLMENINYELSFSFTYCYQCGQNEYRKSFCCICDQRSQDTTHLKMLKCNTCAFYSHLLCSRVDAESAREKDLEQTYQCLNCLLMSKNADTATYNNLTREQCEHYENIHQVVKRHQLLGELCTEILQKYIPDKKRVNMFIQQFVHQNQKFFKQDETIDEWMSLLECNVSFDNSQPLLVNESVKKESKQQQANESYEQQASQMLIKQKKLQVQDKKDRIIQRQIDGQLYDLNNYKQVDFINNQHNLDNNCPSQLKSIIEQSTNKNLIASIIGQKIDSNHNVQPIRNHQFQLNGEMNGDYINNLIAHGQNLSATNKIRSAPKDKDWSDMNLHEVIQPFKTKNNSSLNPDTDKLYDNMYAHKESFLPAQRSLYKSLRLNNLHRYGQKEKYMTTDELETLISTPTNDALQSIDFAELFVKVEFKAVLKIKFQFFNWFDKLVENTLKHKDLFMAPVSEQEEEIIQTNQQADEDVEMISTEVAAANRDRKKQSRCSRKEQRNNNTSQNTDQIKDQEQEDLEMGGAICTDEDYFIDNPQRNFLCIMCKLNGERQVTGRLIPYKLNQYVHVNCAVWTMDVYETHDGELVNFHFAQAQYKNTECTICQQKGASLICINKQKKKCNAAYHFPCAYQTKKVAFLRSKEIFCDSCSLCCSDEHHGVGFLQEFTKKRRLYIVKNLQAWQTNAFQNQTGSQAKNNYTEGNQSNQQMQFQNDEKNNEIYEDEISYETNKWRPFYYDMFNRVGNLTVLSLNKQRNQTIENLFFNLRQKQLLKNRGGHTSSQLVDIQNSFATLRIYWKFYDDKQMTKPVQSNTDTLKLKKSFFLCAESQVAEITKYDYPAIEKYISRRIREYLPSGGSQSALGITQQECLKNQMFWCKQLEHFSHKYLNFSMNKIDRDISWFEGLSKYPINVWNDTKGDQEELRTVKQADFFFKSAQSLIQAQKKEEQNSKELPGYSNLKKQEGMTIDGIFKQMLKANHMSDDPRNPILPTGYSLVNQKQDSRMSTKHIKYEQLMLSLGKKSYAMKLKERREALGLDEQQSEGDGSAMSQKAVEIHPDATTEKKKKKYRGTDFIDTSKGIDLPMNMKYRDAKDKPKRVEVCTSKIHRNGLFTCQDLIPGDIVIEYVGEKIRNKVADKREDLYEKLGIGDCYMFRLDKEYIIDATFFGGKARYLNHSCDANCSAKIITVYGEKHIIISASKHIREAEELTYNYNFELEADKIDCFCGAYNCIGRLN